MFRTTRRCCAALFLLATCSSGLSAQSARPTTDILFKTLMIKSKSGAGTMFSIDVDNREYWLTAKHILTGRKSGPPGEVKQKEVMLEVLDPIGEAIKWNPVRFTVIDPGKDIDIVVLVPKTKLQVVDIRSLKVSSKDYAIGGECSFLGFPYANTWTVPHRNSPNSIVYYKMPFIKHCYISGMILKPVPRLVLDGINNPGFSGGPVLYNTGPNQVVIGVISGYHPETSEVHSIEVPASTAPTASEIGKTHPKSTKREEVVDLNSGIIFAYLAEAAVSAIRKNPIGRPFVTK